MICRSCQKEIPDGSAFCCWCGKKQEITRSRKKRGNGQGTVFKRGNTYTAQITLFRNGNRYQRTKGGFTTKKDAYAWCAENEVLATSKERYTLQELYDLWSSTHFTKISDKKAQQYASAFKNCAKIAPLYWDEISLSLMQEAVENAANTHYQRKAVRTVLHMIEEYAIRSGVTDKEITSYIEIPAAVKPRKETFSEEDIQRLFTSYRSGNRDAGAPLIMIYTGMRIGEIRTIKTENIHVADGYLTGGIKTDAGRTGDIMILPEIAPIIEDLMLPENSFSKYSDTIFRQRFASALEKAGCSPHSTHECRHTFASMLAKKGVQPAIIKELMRHESYEQTITYTHIDRETKLAELSKIM